LTANCHAARESVLVRRMTANSNTKRLQAQKAQIELSTSVVLLLVALVPVASFLAAWVNGFIGITPGGGIFRSLAFWVVYGAFLVVCAVGLADFLILRLMHRWLLRQNLQMNGTPQNAYWIVAHVAWFSVFLPFLIWLWNLESGPAAFVPLAFLSMAGTVGGGGLIALAAFEIDKGLNPKSWGLPGG
jgi:hypothetical protein